MHHDINLIDGQKHKPYTLMAVQVNLTALGNIFGGGVVALNVNGMTGYNVDTVKCGIISNGGWSDVENES